MWCGVLVQLPVSSRRSPAAAPPGTRFESCPPSQGESRFLWKRRLLGWLSQGFGGDTELQPEIALAPPSGVTPLVCVRLEFATTLDDIHGWQADALVQRIRQARSLRDLWHLRTDVFNLVSRHADQHEARARLARLNRHFPSRAPRSGFTPL